MAEVNSLLEDWKKIGARKQIARGFFRIMRHWENEQSGWRIERHGGEEIIWLTKGLEEKLVGLFLTSFYFPYKLALFGVRALLWPIRRKAPWQF
jgi:hypothetical protein